MSQAYELPLAGCRPAPLAAYLKGLGVLRLVATQTDPAARAVWQGDHLVLVSRLTRDDLLDFFVQQYEPTPVLSPWNGGSGFHPKDNVDALVTIEHSVDPRLAPYRQALAAARAALAELGITAKPDTKKEKPALLVRCRGTFPDAALPWLDATTVLAEVGPAFMPLLGTGGNDGRLDFSNNFMQQLLRCLGVTGSGVKNGRNNLEQALFATAAGDLDYSGASMGQFLPGGTGGPNAGAGFEGGSVSNPWDYVLALEGSVCFAGAVARRLGGRTRGRPSFPFTVDAGAVGGLNLADADAAAARAEVWLPLWGRPATWPELEYLLAEGRAQWGRRQARNAVDFAEAAVNLGVDRGITAFQRTGLLLRNGRSYLAVALDRVAVRTFPGTDLLQDPALVNWIDAFRGRIAAGAPISWQRALHRVESAIYTVCTKGGTESAARNAELLRAVLVALAAADQVVARTAPGHRGRLQPLGSLDPRWVGLCADTGPEWHLAAAIAGIRGQAGKVGPLRIHLEPVAPAGLDARGRPQWRWADASRAVTWSAHGSLTDNLARLLSRRLLMAEAAALDTVPLFSAYQASLADLHRFLTGAVDDRLLGEWVLALSLVDLTGTPARFRTEQPEAPWDLPRIYALLKLLFWPGPVHGDVRLLPDRSLMQRLAAGDLDAAGQVALRQLRGRQLPTHLPPHHRGWLVPPQVAIRLLPTLAIPVHDPRGILRRWVLRLAREEKGAVTV